MLKRMTASLSQRRQLNNDRTKSSRWRNVFFSATASALAMLVPGSRASAQGEALGLRLPPGFRVSLYSDETLANDIYAMTLDEQGRVVVTSQGYIKVLHDTQGKGKADKATLFATTKTGGMGLCYDGTDLYFCGDGWFSRYRDQDGDGQADGPPEQFVPLRFTEHGGHAMRKGPDGFWYLIGGNDSEIGSRHVTRADSPVRAPEAGALLRLPPDCRNCEVIAHGFRNPYDFDFNAAGDLFTYDSDVERDYFLPWYSPTRIYHIAYGGHHGWRVTGYLRSWGRRDDYLDTVDILWPVGRGSPTGVVCYRHDQFPEHYRGGVFALDWTFGKIFFFPLKPRATSYETKAEVFLEPVGTNGFAPTDAVVAPDGALLVSIGGRRTRGSVYRIEYAGDGSSPTPRRFTPASEIEAVLHAPQPLDAWSRARWVPLARRLGPAVFAAAIADESQDAVGRVRAVEVLTELFGGLPPETAQAGAHASSALVRARTAWSLGRAPCGDSLTMLAQLARDPEAAVRLAALDALTTRAESLSAAIALEVVEPNLAQPDKRVRQSVARLAARLPQESWDRLWAAVPEMPPQARLTGALAAVWRTPESPPTDLVINQALSVLGETSELSLRFQAVRLIMLAFGDYHLRNPRVEAYTAYSLQGDMRGHEAAVSRILSAVRPLFPSGDERFDAESARLLAMLEDDEPSLPGKVAAFWTSSSSATRDLHYLVVFSRLRGPRGDDLRPRVAEALLGLHTKLRGQEQRNKQVWGDRISELVTELSARDSKLADTLLRHAKFVDPGHVAVAAALDPEHRRQAARLFRTAVQNDPDFPWSGALVELLAGLPREEVLPLLRSQWNLLGLRDAILLELAKTAEETDREKFLTGLESSDPQVVNACLGALEHLPRDDSSEHLVAPLRLLRRLLSEPKAASLRSRVLALIARQAGQAFAVTERETDPAHLQRAYQPCFDWFSQHYPKLTDALEGTNVADLDAWHALLESVDWSQGDNHRGEAIFVERGCQTCHAGTSRIGPDLTGVTNRFSREDLFTAIISPSRDVAPAYRTNVIETKDGQLFEGIAIFESADGVILQTSATGTMRIADADISERHTGQRSLMPDGLLKDLSPADVANLYRYLQTLKPNESGREAR